MSALTGVAGICCCIFSLLLLLFLLLFKKRFLWSTSSSPLSLPLSQLSITPLRGRLVGLAHISSQNYAENFVHITLINSNSISIIKKIQPSAEMMSMCIVRIFMVCVNNKKFRFSNSNKSQKFYLNCN